MTFHSNFSPSQWVTEWEQLKAGMMTWPQTELESSFDMTTDVLEVSKYINNWSHLQDGQDPVENLFSSLLYQVDHQWSP